MGSAEIVLLDASAGFGRETLAAIEAADEIVIVTNPEISAVTDALKASKISEQLGTKVTGLILNRVTGKNYEMTTRDIMGMLDNINLIGEVPEDVEVQKSVAARNPVIRHSPKSAASNRIMRIAASLVGEEDNFREVTPWYKKMFSFSRR